MQNIIKYGDLKDHITTMFSFYMLAQVSGATVKSRHPPRASYVRHAANGQHAAIATSSSNKGKILARSMEKFYPTASMSSISKQRITIWWFHK